MDIKRIDIKAIDIKAIEILPYTAMPLIIGLYLALKYNSESVITIICGVSLITFGYIAAYTDIKRLKVPNKLVLAMLVAWLLLMAGYVIVDIKDAINFIIQSLLSGAAAGVFFLIIYYVSRRGVGGGDVKLIAVMGLFMTFTKLMTMLFFSSLLAALVSAILLLTKRATMKTAIPLVPFLYLGTLITIFM